MTKILRHRVTWRLAMLVAFETLLVLSAVVLAAYLRLGNDAWREIEADQALPKGALIALVAQICLYYGDLYDRWIVRNYRDLFVQLLRSLGATSLLLAAIYFWLPDLIVGRGVFAIASVFVIAFLIG